MVRSFVLLAVFSVFFVSQATAQFNSEPALEGHVTRAVSLSDFDVNGIHVQSDRKTSVGITTRADHSLITRGRSIDPLLGEAVSVIGKMDKRNHRVIATGILFYRPETIRIGGSAIIDRILSPLKSGEILVRADGYPIRINFKTEIKFAAPLTSLSGVTSNVWLTYRGSLRDGVVIADSVMLSPNQIEHAEEKLLRKTDYDPSAVNDSAKQSYVKQVAIGVDPKQIPPYRDAAMQARIERIGKSLVPEYQKALSESDETKIPFQFQLVDYRELRYAWALPSGVILVPWQIVELLKNDSQLAAVLADGVSCALEKQAYREQPSDTTKALSTIAGGLVGGVTLLGAVAYLNYGWNLYGTNSPIQRRYQEQRDRVALSLMHDAGYDLNEVPKVWWLLAAKDASHVADTAMPTRTIHLYEIMGQVWHDEADHHPVPTASNNGN